MHAIQSGSGISHSEFIQKNSSIFQIWFDPNINKTYTTNLNTKIISLASSN